MKKLLIITALLFFAENNYAHNKQPDKYQSYLGTWGSVSSLFSRLLDNIDVITHRPDKISFKQLAVDFNHKVTAMIINENHFITIINNKNASDAAFNNSYRILENNVAGLKKILTGNRGLIDQLNMPNFKSADVYEHLDTRLYENDALIKDMPAKQRTRSAFKRKIVDNSTQTIIILNEIHSKVSALYSKLK